MNKHKNEVFKYRESFINELSKFFTPFAFGTELALLQDSSA